MNTDSIVEIVGAVKYCIVVVDLVFWREIQHFRLFFVVKYGTRGDL